MKVFSVALLALVVLGVCTVLPTARGDDGGVSILVMPSRDECFYEEIAGLGVKTFFHYMVTAGGSLDIEAVIRGPDGSVIWQSDRDEENRVLFKTRMVGRHSFCFSNKMSTVTPKIIAFSIMLGDGTGAGTVSGAGDDQRQDSLQRSIERIQMGLREVEEIQKHMKTREGAHRATTEVANTRVVLWCMLEIAVIVAMGCANVFYLRKMFTTKRMV